MATISGHIYTKNNSGQIDKFVPIINSSEVKHGLDTVENVLDDTINAVETEIESGTETITGPVIETYTGSNSWSFGFRIYDSNYSSMYNCFIDDNITSITTNTLYTSSQFTVSNTTGFGISFGKGNEEYWEVMANGTYEWDTEFTISNSPYAEDSNNPGMGLISVSELPSIGQSKIFYATCYCNYGINLVEEEYTGTDIKFTITNVDGTNYTLSFIWEKTEIVTVTTKSLKTTITKNDGTTASTISPISGLLQNMNINSNQNLENAIITLTSVPAYIEINDTSIS